MDTSCPHLHLCKSCYIQQGFTKKTKLIPCKLRNEHIMRKKLVAFHFPRYSFFTEENFLQCLVLYTYPGLEPQPQAVATLLQPRKSVWDRFRCLVWYEVLTVREAGKHISILKVQEVSKVIFWIPFCAEIWR